MTYSVRLEDFESIGDEWERVLPQCRTNTIFVTPRWQNVWWRRFGEGWQLSILSVRDDGDLIGIAPLMIREGVVSFIGDKDLYDYQDFVVPEGNEEAFYRTLCEHLLKLEWSSLDLSSLPQGSSSLAHLPDIARGLGLSVEVVEEDTTPLTGLPSTWEEYLSGLRKKDRHELRRKMRRLDNADSPHQYVCEDEACLSCGMQDFFRLHRASSGEKGKFMTPEREGFFMDLATELAPADQFKLYFLEVDGVRVACCICFDYDGSYLLYNSGYDPRYSALSVGLINKALCLRDAIEGGRRVFNFLKGTERYKYDLGAKDEKVYSMVVRR